MENYAQILFFLKVAELKSFSGAAQQLNITPTAVSKQIKNLEAIIKEQLFIRTTRTVLLTEFGEHFYVRCKALQAHMESLDQFVQSKKETPQGNLTVMVSNALFRKDVMQRLSEFISQYPEIKLEIIFADGDKNIINDSVDVLIGFPQIPPVTDNMQYRKLLETNNILCASPAFIKNYGKPETADDLMNFRFVSHSLRRPGIRLPLIDGTWLNCAPPILFMNDYAAANQACLDGIGIFLTADTLVHEHLASGELVKLLPRIAFRRWDIYIFYRSYEYELPKIRAFVDYYSTRT